MKWEKEATVAQSGLEAMSDTLYWDEFDNISAVGLPTPAEVVGMPLSRDATSLPPSILSEDDSEGIPQDTQVSADPVTSLKPVSFQATLLLPAVNAAAPASMANLTLNMSN